MPGKQFRRRIDFSRSDQDRIAFGMAGTAVVSQNAGMILLMGDVLGHRAGNQVYRCVLPIDRDGKIGFGRLVALGKKALMDDQLRPVRQLSRGFAVSAVYAANLHSVHFQNGILCQIDVADRVNAANTRTGAGADMLFLIEHMGALFYKKPVDTVVAGFFLTVGMDAAAGDNGDMGALSHIKIVVYQIVDVAVGHAGRDVDGFILGLRRYMDHKARRSFFRFDPDMLGGLPSGSGAIHTDIVSAAECAFPVGNKSQ